METQRGAAFYSIRPPGAQVFIPSHHFAGIMLAPSAGIRATLGSEKVHEFDAPTGHIVINPADVESTLNWASTRENAVIAIKPESLRELALIEFGSDNVELEPPPFGTVDQTALSIAQALRDELTRLEGANELYVDSLVTMFAVHILRHYTAGRKPTPSKGSLGREAARRVKDYIGANFTSAPSVAELAAVAGLSPTHFSQAFAKRFGMAPHRYVLDMRLDLAERLLQEGSLPIVEVAHASGFSSQSHLTTALKRYRGKTPAQARLVR